MVDSIPPLQLATTNKIEYRDSCASTDEDENDNFPTIVEQSSAVDDDSESEFTRILDMCRRQRELTLARMNDENSAPSLRPPKPNNKVFDSEYYSLPKIEELKIQVKEESEFKKFGIVESHINFIAKIVPNKDSPHLGYETVLFNVDKCPVGEIFEVFGTVGETIYALRFNSEEEAREKLPIGAEVYYVAADNDVTKPVFPQELAKLKTWERMRRNTGASSSSEEFFSDDDEEHQKKNKKKVKNNNRSCSESSNCAVPSKRPRVGARREAAAAHHRNPFQFSYPRQRNFAPQHWHHNAGPASSYNMMAPAYFGHPHPWPRQQWVPPPSPNWSNFGVPPPPNLASFPSPSGPQPHLPLPYQQKWGVPPSPNWSHFGVPPPPPQNLATFSPQPTNETNTNHQFFNNQCYIPQKQYTQHREPGGTQQDQQFDGAEENDR